MSEVWKIQQRKGLFRALLIREEICSPWFDSRQEALIWMYRKFAELDAGR